MALLELNNVHAYYGNIHALKGVSLVVEQGGAGRSRRAALIALVGRHVVQAAAAIAHPPPGLGHQATG